MPRGHRLVLTGNETLMRQLANNGTLARIGPENFYLGNEWHGRTLRRADADGRQWIEQQPVERPGAAVGEPVGATTRTRRRAKSEAEGRRAGNAVDRRRSSAWGAV